MEIIIFIQGLAVVGFAVAMIMVIGLLALSYKKQSKRTIS